MMNPEAVKHLAGNSNSNGGSLASASKHCHHYHHRKRSNTLESGLIEKRRASHVKRRDSSGSIRSLTSGWVLMSSTYIIKSHSVHVKGTNILSGKKCDFGRRCHRLTVLFSSRAEFNVFWRKFFGTKCDRSLGLRREEKISKKRWV